MRAKICGICSYEDAKVAVDAGADALGFVLYPPSPRYITPKRAKEIIKKLPPFIEKVALFVNEDATTINATCRNIGATLAQIHFEAPLALYDKLKIPHLKVVRAASREDLLLYSSEYRLVDAFSKNYGGSGRRLALEWFSEVDCSKIILAGGLDPSNLDELRGYGFYGVDVSSGVERAKGVKDRAKVEAFVRRAKEII